VQWHVQDLRSVGIGRALRTQTVRPWPHMHRCAAALFPAVQQTVQHIALRSEFYSTLVQVGPPHRKPSIKLRAFMSTDLVFQPRNDRISPEARVGAVQKGQRVLADPVLQMRPRPHHHHVRCLFFLSRAIHCAAVLCMFCQTRKPVHQRGRHSETEQIWPSRACRGRTFRSWLLFLQKAG
jgi:hypothetical protein